MKLILKLIFLIFIVFEANSKEVLYNKLEFKSDVDKVEQYFGKEKIKQTPLDEYVLFIENKILFRYENEKRLLSKHYLLMKYYFYRNDFVNLSHQRLSIITKFASDIDDKELGTLTMMTGDSYYRSENYSLANFFFKKCIHNKLVNKSTLYTKMASCYLSIHELDSANLYFRKALSRTSKIDAQLYLINNIGYVQFLMGNNSQALMFYQDVVDLYITNGNGLDSMHLYNVYSNIATVNFETALYDKALDYIALIETSDFYKNSPLEFKFEIQTKKFLILSKIESCEKLTDRFKQLQRNFSELQSDKDRLKLCELRFDHAISCSDQQEISDARDQLNELRILLNSSREKKEIRSQELNQLIYTDQITTIDRNLELENQAKELLERSNIRLQIALVLTIFLLIGLIALFILWKRQGKKRMELTEVTLENQRLQFRNLIDDKSSNTLLFSEIKLKLKSMLEKGKESNDEEIRNLVQFVNSQLKNEEQKTKILNLSDAKEDNLRFKIDFCRAHKNLTETEIQVIMLIRLGMSNKEIATFRNIEPHSIRVFKNRLKKKLSIPTDTNLNNYIKEFKR
ncbi:MAG: LuxR C-terminal-related transcriptional regulator [Crocinitomicaceae bacterium]|nr:LuxR C-terminal-related transcriptional regulator [Crocinitomicaceae bacterium]